MEELRQAKEAQYWGREDQVGTAYQQWGGREGVPGEPTRGRVRALCAQAGTAAAATSTCRQPGLSSGVIQTQLGGEATA